MGAHAKIGTELRAVAVCVERGASPEGFERTLQAVLTHTPADVAIVVQGESETAGANERLGSTDRAVFTAVDAAAAVSAAAPADVVLLRSGCVVADGWLEGLRDAAYVHSRVASATALSDEGSPASVRVPAANRFDEAAARVRAGSLRIRPRVQAAGDHCAYVRRSAVELVGSFTDLAKFSRDALHRGLCHVVADDVLIGSAGVARAPAARAAASAPLTQSLAAGRRALEGLSIAIDARILAGPMNGSKLHVLELAAAVARTAEHRVTAIVTPDLDPETRGRLEGVPGLEVANAPGATDSAPARADVAHRPFQVESPADLRFLAQLADRSIITQQDLIGYNNPGYFPSVAGWESYRALTRRAMAVADHVLFFSAHVRDEALDEQLVEPHRASVVHIGVDHGLANSTSTEAAPPRGVERIAPGAELVLCIGTDYEHKNRRFALTVASELQRSHGWRGWLIFAGSHVPWGGSSPEERRLLESDPSLSESVLDLGLISEAEKRWLLRRVSLALYPTVSEGFGLVPFEAADYDVPCMWARGTSLSEILPDSAAAIVPWDAAASADRAIVLMRDDEARAANVRAIREAAASLRWDAAAERLIELYRTTAEGPPAPAGALEREQGLMREDFSEDAVRLVGPEGALPRELERPLLALATHPRLRTPVFGAIKAGYRASFRLRRSRPDGPR